MRSIVLAISMVFLSACTQSEPPAGGDKDEHGCVGTADYRWCEKTQRCERPLDLAKQEGFNDAYRNFDRFCLGHPVR